jgi:hypothetical protein
MDNKRRRWKCVGWIHMALDKDQWPAVVNTEMNSRIP